MMTRQTTSGKAKSAIGMVIVALGLAVLAPKFVGLAPLLNGTLQELTQQTFNALPSIGLGVLHAGQTLAFEPGTFFARVLGILVSFWPLLVVAVGTFLLRNDAGVWPLKSGVNGRASSEGVR